MLKIASNSLYELVSNKSITATREPGPYFTRKFKKQFLWQVSGWLQFSSSALSQVPGSMMRHGRWGGGREDRAWRGRWGAPAVLSSLNVIYRNNLLSVRAGPTVPYLCQDHLQQ